jgi:hypothetical protein
LESLLQQQQQKRPQQFQILDHSSKTSSPFFIADLHKGVLSFFLSFFLVMQPLQQNLFLRSSQGIEIRGHRRGSLFESFELLVGKWILACYCNPRAPWQLQKELLSLSREHLKTQTFE